MKTHRNWIAALRDTPPEKRDVNVFKHQIFWAESLPGVRLRSDVAERAALKDDAAQRRWDFFHRPDPSDIDEVDAAQLAEIRRKQLARTALVRNALFLLVGAVAIGVGVGALGYTTAAIGVFVVLASAIGVYFMRSFSRDAELDEALEAVNAFRDKVDQEIVALSKKRPSPEAMRAARDAAMVREVAAAAAAAGASEIAATGAARIFGWAALNDAADAFGPAHRRRAFARAGGVFAVTDFLIALPLDDRLHIRRATYDAITDRTQLLEEWELQASGAQIGRAIRHAPTPTPPVRDPDPALRDPNQPKVAPEPEPPLMTLRELTIASSATRLQLKISDAAMHADLIASNQAELAQLKRDSARKPKASSAESAPKNTPTPEDATKPGEKSAAKPPATADHAAAARLEESRRAARNARLEADISELNDASAAEPKVEAFVALRRALFERRPPAPTTPPASPPPPTDG